MKPARPAPCHHASRDPVNEIVQGSEEPAATRVHAPAAAIRRASLIKINYVCRVIARLIESRDSTASPVPAAAAAERLPLAGMQAENGTACRGGIDILHGHVPLRILNSLSHAGI